MSRFVLVDCNNFYVSCERLFHPKLEGRPVIVLSNNDGCAVARSQEAKKLGIKMGDPFFKIKDFCHYHKVVVFSSNYEFYGDISQRVMNMLAEVAEEIQIYSIDEAFLTYSNHLSKEDLFQHCLELRHKIKRWTGIPTSMGIAPTKTLAKVASKLAKKDLAKGVYDLSSASLQESVLREFPLGDIWGIGRRLEMRLRALGIYTAWQFREQDPLLIRKKLGVVGERMLWELRGVSCLPLEQVQAKKSICCSRSFGQAITNLQDLSEALSTYVNSAGIKLREQRSCTKALCVFVESVLDAQMGTRAYDNAVIAFPMPTNDTPQMISSAKKCLATLFRKEQRYKKCGVILLDLVAEESMVPDLFQQAPHPKRRLVAQTVDALNEHFGKNTLFYGAMGVNPHWKMRSDSRSRCYTTRWEDLAVVKA